MAKKKTYTQTMAERAKVAGGASLKPCPFCGLAPALVPWHGGRPTKMMVMCRDNDCDVGPMVTGETLAQAVRRWNGRTAASNPVYVPATPDF